MVAWLLHSSPFPQPNPEAMFDQKGKNPPASLSSSAQSGMAKDYLSLLLA